MVSKWIKNLKGNKVVQHLKKWYKSVLNFDLSGKPKTPLLPGTVANQKAPETRVRSTEYTAETESQRNEVNRTIAIIAKQPSVQQSAKNVDAYNQYMHTHVPLTHLGLISKDELKHLLFHFITQNRLDGNRQENVAQLQNELNQVNAFNMNYFSYKADSTVGQLTRTDINNALAKLKDIICNNKTYITSNR